MRGYDHRVPSVAWARRRLVRKLRAGLHFLCSVGTVATEDSYPTLLPYPGLLHALVYGLVPYRLRRLHRD